MERPITVIESPYSNGTLFSTGKIISSIEYAWVACKDSMKKGEAPIASHLLYPQFLDDTDTGHRRLGIECGYAFARPASTIAFYIDLGFSTGMLQALDKFSNDKSLTAKICFRSATGNANQVKKYYDAMADAKREEDFKSCFSHLMIPRVSNT